MYRYEKIMKYKETSCPKAVVHTRVFVCLPPLIVLTHASQCHVLVVTNTAPCHYHTLW